MNDSSSEKAAEEPAVFLSHSSGDKRFVRRLADALEDYDVRVWLDEADIRIGDVLNERLRQGISQSDFLIVVLSPAAIESDWVRQELELAESIEQDEGRSIVMPVLIEDVSPTLLRALVGDRLFADFRNPRDFQHALAGLLRSMSWLEPFGEMIEHFEESLITMR
ncbi:MAG: toll/interleukin-1 receptor domain-containing protein, partial [Verrucomicrobiota bacterium]